MNHDEEACDHQNIPVKSHPGFALARDVLDRLPQGVVVGLVIAAAIVTGVWLLQR